MSRIITYFGTDGLLHIIVSAILTIAFTFVLNVWQAAALTFLIGTAKEAVWDYALKRGVPESKDLLADIIGVIIGAL